MSSNVILKGELRENLGTGAARELRKKGMIPVTIYGGNNKPLSVSVEEKEVTKLYRKHGFTSTMIEIEVAGKKHKVVPNSVELHPTKELVRHADFIFLNEKGTQKVLIPLVYEGKEKSLGVKRGGFFNTIKRKITLNCPVNEIPLDIKIDVSKMSVGESITTSNITLPNGCSFASKKEIVLASMTGKRGKSSDAEEDKEEGKE